MRSFRWPVVVVVALALAPVAPALQGEAEPAIHVAGGDRPPVLDLLGEPDANLLAVAISADGNRAAAAVERSPAPQRSELRLYELGRPEPFSLEIAGRLRDLLFSRDGSVVYALQHKSAKKREGDTYLMTVDWATVKAKRGMRVPASAAGLDHWIARDALLIAGRNEIRTVLLPELRSGPLFRVPGVNTCVASLGADLVLVGQEDGIVLVDLGAPSGREAMPVEARAGSPTAVTSLAAEPDGRGALARLADGRLFSVELRPLALAERAESALDVTAPAPEVTEPEPPPPAVAEEPEPEPPPPLPPVVVEEPELPPPPPPVVTEEPEPEPVEPTPVDTEPEVAEPEPPPPPPVVAEEPEPEPVGAPPVDTEPDIAEPEPIEAAHQIQGRIEGPAAGRVESVVLFGPDNILREAARVRPTSGSRWHVDGLSPGRYRVQLDGGGGAVLVTEPRFLLLTVSPGEAVRAPVLKVLRAL